jgi:hypothetical protein
MLFLVFASSFRLCPCCNVDLKDILSFPGGGGIVLDSLDNYLWLDDVIDSR